MASGSDQVFAISPDACYAIADVLVDGLSVGTPSTYTFTNVTADHSISASFVLPTAVVSVTSDVNPSIWAQSVTFTATVTPGNATGTVTFRDSLTFLGTAILSAGLAQLVKSNLYTGAHTAITARYNGDACFAAVSSPAYSQRVYRAASTCDLTVNPDPSAFGSPTTLTATLPIGATGRVAVLDGGAPVGTAAVNATTGRATLNVGNLLPGSHCLTFNYPGDSHYEPCSSAPVCMLVTKLPTIVTVAVSPNPALCRQDVTMTATVAPSDAQGTVEFHDGTTLICSAPVVSGSATCVMQSSVTPALAVGTHSLSARFTGSPVYEASPLSPPQVLTVNKAPSTIAVTSDLNPSFFGQGVTFRAQLTPSQAGGTITWFDSLTFIGSGNPLIVSNLVGGRHQIIAKYSGEACFLGSMSAPYFQQVNTSPTVISVTSDVNPAVFGQTITITATMIPIGGAAFVQFYIDGHPIGRSPISPLIGLAKLKVNNLIPGPHVVTACFLGDRNYSPCCSPPYDQLVSRQPTITDVTSNGNPSLFGLDVDLIATVMPTIPGSGLPTGSIEITEGATSLGTAPIDEGSGVGLVTASNPSVGTHHYCATYLGNTFFLPSSACFDQEVRPFVSLPQQAAGMVTKLTAETIESAVRVSWAGSAAGFASLELQRASSVAGPWDPVHTVLHEEAGRSVAEDVTAEPGRTYFYRLLGMTRGGLQTVYGPVEGTAAAPKAFALAGAWPNPSRGSMTMAITVPRASNVRLSVLDLQGREVAVLADGVYSAGRHEMRWDGRTDHGVAASGLYFIRYVTPEQKFLSRVAIAR